MDTKHTIKELNTLQALVQPADDAVEQLSTLMHSHEGPLFDAVGRLMDEIIRRIAGSIGTDYELLADWWLAHKFGSVPMSVTINSGLRRVLHSNAELAEFLAELNATGEEQPCKQ